MSQQRFNLLKESLDLDLLLANCDMFPGLELPGAGLGEVEPPSSCLQTLILSENEFKISIPVQNFKHFDI